MRKNRKKQNQRNKMMIIIALLVILTFTLLITQIIKLVKSTSNIKNGEVISNVVSDEKQRELDKEELKFDTFVDKVYAEKEIEGLSITELERLLKLDGVKIKNIDCKRIAGSAKDVNEAKKIAGDVYATQNQFVLGANIIEDDDIFYVVNVRWRYVSENVNNIYEQKVLVFKKFYFDIENQILNLDEADKIKLVLDLDNYVRNKNNSEKKLVQSFMHKEGKICKYVLYYIDANYSIDGQRDRIDLVKEIITINPETGKIEQREDIIVE